MRLDLPTNCGKVFAYSLCDVRETLPAIEHLLNGLAIIKGEVFPAHIGLLSAGMQQLEDTKTEAGYQPKMPGASPRTPEVYRFGVSGKGDGNNVQGKKKERCNQLHHPFR